MSIVFSEMIHEICLEILNSSLMFTHLNSSATDTFCLIYDDVFYNHTKK